MNYKNIVNITKQIPEFIKLCTCNKSDESYFNKTEIHKIEFLIFQLIKLYEIGFEECINIIYYIHIKLAIITNDLKYIEKLSDLCLNIGYFPLYKLFSNDDSWSIEDELRMSYIELTYKNESKNYIETKEQFISRNLLLSSKEKEICYIAPTSFGKSDAIIELVTKNIYKNILIIVPTKSLLNQVLKELKKTNENWNIFSSEEMFFNEEKNIGVMTQERTYRFIRKNRNIKIDLLIIDECHNLLKEGDREILTSRVIELTKRNNLNVHVRYFSPFINDANNLNSKFDTNNIETIKIKNNIKVPEYYLFDANNVLWKYNQFVDELFEIESRFLSPFDYINEKKDSKNFYYISSPPNIEKFSQLLYDKLDDVEINNEEYLEVSNIISNNVHENFSQIKFLKKGIVSIHAQMDEGVRKYLESLVTKYTWIKHIVANSIILEGINLPINNLFILSTYHEKVTDINNLVGRVNRLTYILNKNNSNIHRLLPQVHLVQIQEFWGSVKKTQNFLSRNFYVFNKKEDEVKNVMLLNCETNNKQHRYELELELIASNKNLNNNYSSKLLDFDMISFFYQNLISEYSSILFQRINENDFGKITIDNVIEKIWEIFYKDNEKYIFKKELDLTNSYKRMAIQNFISKEKKLDLHRWLLRKLITKRGGKIFVAKKYFSEMTVDFDSLNSETRIIALIINRNISVSEFKYKIMKFVEFMYENNLLSHDVYNLIKYDTVDDFYINLRKLGMKKELIEVFKKNRWNEYIEIKNNYIYYSKDLKKVITDLDGFKLNMWNDITRKKEKI